MSIAYAANIGTTTFAQIFGTNTGENIGKNFCLNIEFKCWCNVGANIVCADDDLLTSFSGGTGVVTGYQLQ